MPQLTEMTQALLRLSKMRLNKPTKTKTRRNCNPLDAMHTIYKYCLFCPHETMYIKEKKSQINAAHYDGCHTLSQALPNTPRILYKVLQFTQDSFLDLDGTFQDGK